MATNSILAKMVVQIVANNAQFAAAMKRSEAQMKGFQKTAQSLNNAFRGLGIGLGIMEAARGIEYAVRTVADFEKSMSEVRAITNASDSEFKALRDSALELGRTTLYTARQVSELQVAFGRLGFSNQEILDSTAATLQLATATGEDLAKSADIAGSTLRAFNLDAKEMQRVVDVMASSFNKSALGLENFGEAIKYVAPVAAAANISLEETTAMLGVLADAGIRGSMAGTSLRKIISEVKEESGTLSERLQKLADKGLTGADAMDEVGRTAYASLLILTKHIGKVNDATVAYSNVTGEAKKMADLMSDNLTGDITKLTSAFDGLILKFSEGAGPLRDMVQLLTQLVSFLATDEIVSFLKFTTSVGAFVPRMIGKGISALTSEDEQPQTLPPGPHGPNMPDPFSLVKGIQFQNKALDEQAGILARLIELWNKQNSIFSEKFDASDQIKEKTGADFLFDSGAMVEMANAGANALSTLDGALEVNSNAWDVWLSGVQARSQQFSEIMEKHQEKTQKLAEISQTVGGALGDVFSTIATDQENLVQAMLRATEQIITMFLQQSIAGMIAAAMKDPSTPFPFAKIAIAAAGIAAVKGMFSALGSASAGGGGSGAVSAPGRTPSELNTRVTGRIRGYDLALVSEKESYRRGRLG